MKTLENLFKCSVPFVSKRLDAKTTLVEFLHQIEASAAELTRMGKEQDEVFLCHDRIYDCYCWFFAALVTDRPVVIFSNNAHPEWESAVSAIRIDSTTELPSLQELNRREPPLALCLDAKLAFFTSGSTGQPKRVDKVFANLLSEVEVLESLFGVRPLPTVISSVSHLHIYGFLFSGLWPLLSGSPIATETCLYQEDLQSWFEYQGPCRLVATPAFLKRLQVTSDHQAPMIQVLSSGGVLNGADAKKCTEILGANNWPIEILGSTETGGVAYRTQENGNISWKFFSGVVGDASDQQTLTVKSPFIYEGEFKMADRVEFDREGGFVLLGRTDRIVKIEEKRVSLAEMEAFLLESDLVNDCVVLPLELAGRQQTAALIQWSKAGQQWSESKTPFERNQWVREWMSQRFERVTLPRRFKFVETVPVNSQGKKVYSELLRFFDE